MKDIILKIAIAVFMITVFTAVAILANLYNYRAIQLNKTIPEVIGTSSDMVLKIEGKIIQPGVMMFGGKRTDILALRKNLIHKVKEGYKHIYLQINSGGGMMDPGMKFVDTMRSARQHGVEFTCIVDGVAMSMAVIIFSECDTRYATFGSKIMWHSIAYRGNMSVNVDKAKELVSLIEIQNEIVWHNTRIYFWPSYFAEHFRKETKIDVSEIEQKSFGYLRVIRQFNIIKRDYLKEEK